MSDATRHHRGRMTAPPTRWRCRNCRAVMTREQCAVRSGILECPGCLRQHQVVDLLEPIRDEPPCEVFR